MEFILSDTAPDHEGLVVDVKSLDLSIFESNPVMLWNHDRDQPIGYWELKRDGDVLIGVPHFASTPFAQEKKTLVEDGAVRTASIGFRTNPETTNPNEYGDFTCENGLLLEVSLTSVPMNPRALRTRAESDKDMKKKTFVMKRRSEEAPAEEKPEVSLEDLAGRIDMLAQAVAALTAKFEQVEISQSEEEDKEESEEDEELSEDEDENKQSEEEERAAWDYIRRALGK